MSAPADHEHRKTVTVLFCDVVGSTAIGEQADPEAVRALLARYFERMTAIVESHGGTIEKFIGDAVMAVFGVPQAHEDDALRACRGAVEMRAALPELGIGGRIGVNTGEVVTGTAERLATGDAVNVAARLEQAAAAGEILVGAQTFALVRDAVEAEPVEPLTLKGKVEPVPAFRLVSLLATPERSHQSRFVGRQAELELVSTTCARARSEGRCELLTVVGEAGVGKSRLVAEALAGIESRVIRARCLPYGDGITYWPVVELIKQLNALPSDEAAARALRSVLGESERPTSADEIAWAVRKLLEEQAPLVVCIDDLQWGEETFLDLVESIALLSSGAPLLLLGMARPELLERRPTWPGALRLEPLAAHDVEELIGPSVPQGMRRRIADNAGGNPLFVTEMLALAAESDEVEVPPTLRALLAARLDQLDERERRVLERGAVEGEIFHRGAVQALAPEEPEVLPRLAALVRHELIRPDRPQLPGEDGFRFRHLLIRDAAYEALPKSVRADLHRRFADWLEKHGQTLVELDEILGYHLEQAARYQSELGVPDPSLAQRAGELLLRAGRRAQDRDDQRAAAALLARGLALTRPVRLDVNAELDLAVALLQEPGRAAEIAEAAATGARGAGDEAGEALARAMTLHFRRMVDPGAGSIAELERLLLDARGRLEDAEDHAGLAQVWGTLGFGVANAQGRFDDWATASDRAFHHSRLAGRATVPLYSVAIVYGSRPADEALDVVDRQLAETPSAWLLLSRAWLLAMLDHADEARQVADEGNAWQREQSGARWGEWILAEIATLRGNDEEASDRLHFLCEWLESMEQIIFLENYLSLTGHALCRLGRFDEAADFAERAASFAEPHGEATDASIVRRQLAARVQAFRGDLAGAEQMARDAVASADQTDSFYMQGFALWDLAEVLALADRNPEAATALEHALERCRQKKNLALARRIGERLAELRA